MAERAETAARYAEWEIIGLGEERWPIGGYFNPGRREGECRDSPSGDPVPTDSGFGDADAHRTSHRHLGPSLPTSQVVS